MMFDYIRAMPKWQRIAILAIGGVFFVVYFLKPDTSPQLAAMSVLGIVLVIWGIVGIVRDERDHDGR